MCRNPRSTRLNNLNQTCSAINKIMLIARSRNSYQAINYVTEMLSKYRKENRFSCTKWFEQQIEYFKPCKHADSRIPSIVDISTYLASLKYYQPQAIQEIQALQLTPETSIKVNRAHTLYLLGLS